MKCFQSRVAFVAGGLFFNFIGGGGVVVGVTLRTWSVTVVVVRNFRGVVEF